MTSSNDQRGETRSTAGTDQLAHPTLYWRRLIELGPELGGDWHPVHGGGPQLELPTEPTAQGEAEIVEADGTFEIHDVGSSTSSRFEFFLDGIEYTRICGYIGVVPIVHGYVAAVVRQRRDREFTTWDVREEEVLAFPHALVPPGRFRDLGFPAEILLDSASEADQLHPIGLAESGRAAVKFRRAAIERGLAREWARQRPGAGWLFVDGRLAIDPDLLKSGRAIGLVKSHRTQFLSPRDMTRVLQMAGQHRSSIFKPVRPEIGEVYSWYLRLRPTSGRDIYWALARIEARRDPETIELADEISRWLLAETSPLALPDPRWHVLMYPIRDCETFLRSRKPTLEVS